MTPVNNIYNFKVNTIANNGSINFGNVIHKGHQSNVKANIGSLDSGDSIHSPSQSNNLNNTVDPDLVDQLQKQL